MRFDREFATTIRQRDIDVAEAFGIGDGFRTEISADVPDEFGVLLITGESGSGKSVIAHGVWEEPAFEDNSLPAVDFLGIPHEESLRWLTSFGLGDAKTFTLPYSALSDSQRARLRAMDATYRTRPGGVVLIDEFLSTLDRSTARFTAMSIAKAVRRGGRRLVAVTAHSDLEPWLSPDWVIEGRSYPCRFETRKGRSFDPLASATVRHGTKEEYRECPLGAMHYRGKYTGGVKDYLFCDFEGEPIGVLVGTNRICDDPDARRIARLVVHPKARGCGIGSMLVRAYLQEHEDVDVVASMARFSSVFESAGMEPCPPSVSKPPAGMARELSGLDFDTSMWHSERYCRDACESEPVRAVVASHSDKAVKLVQPGGAHLTAEEVAERILSDPQTAGRVLWWMRPREYAKFRK